MKVQSSLYMCVGEGVFEWSASEGSKFSGELGSL